MSSTFRHWKDRLQCSTKRNICQSHLLIDDEFKNLRHTTDLLLNDNNLLKARIDKLDERYQQWINDEQNFLLKRIENLENENHQLLEIYLTYQIQNETCIRSITDLIMKILLTQQELSKERTERYNKNDVAQWRKKQQQDDSRCTNNDQTTWLHQRLMNVSEQDQQTTNHSLVFNNQSPTVATVKSKSDKSSSSTTGLSNRIYFLMNKEKTLHDNRRLPGINIVPIDDVNASPRKQQSSVTFNKNISNQQQTRTTYPNHERLSTQTTHHTSSTGKNIPITSISKPSRVPTTTIRPQTTNIRQRPSAPSTINQKTVSSSSITNKSVRPRYTLAKSSETPRSAGTIATTTTITTAPVRPTKKTLIVNKPNLTATKPTTNSIKTRKPIVNQQSARVSDLDVLMAERQKTTTTSKKSTIVTPSPVVNNIQQSLFRKDKIKVVRPVRSQELKLFSCHLTPKIPPTVPNEIIYQTNESLSTLTPSSFESIADNKPIEKKEECSDSSSNVISINRDFSEDSLNEHYYIQKLLQKNASINSTKKNDHIQDQSSESDIPLITPIKTETSVDSAYGNGSIEQENKETNMKNGYFLLTNDKLTVQDNQLLSKAKSSSHKSLVHRLIFPARLGRMIFYRRILSDSDIYQKICTKDNEIYHNVYHLDTIRDYSMEFYMITTYASDSQLRAWVDSNDDEIVNNVCHMDENRFQIDDYNFDYDENQIEKMDNSDSLIEEEEEGELDWYSELEILNLSSNNQQDKQESTSSCSSKLHVEELLHAELFSLSSPTTTTSVESSSSTGLGSASWTIPKDTSDPFQSTPNSYDNTNQSNSILREILNHSWTDHMPISSGLSDERNFEQYENDSTSSIITDEFQSDFYYLCPVTNTTNFSKTDPKTLFHDV
ncbi:unnamed protein product [Adineta steineri]|uniref:Uncharacterized protein n=1 Tax=Adineta steineri TaxID=433720 RepID=A0A818Q879_9BILA|nr:unnamed protein product [Adineta steineri]CAF3635419.1 unnamed protein product [Adineta steineri]